MNVDKQYLVLINVYYGWDEIAFAYGIGSDSEEALTMAWVMLLEKLENAVGLKAKLKEKVKDRHYLRFGMWKDGEFRFNVTEWEREIC